MELIKDRYRTKGWRLIILGFGFRLRKLDKIRNALVLMKLRSFAWIPLYRP